ncbi:hypothetical protein EalM132_00105 [Exiguobacterium phage vB_EalM-132]|nr:hypothetical protein EalM132_00105 [Exiguobacterium phage vB_EalM-132]
MKKGYAIFLYDRDHMSSTRNDHIHAITTTKKKALEVLVEIAEIKRAEGYVVTLIKKHMSVELRSKHNHWFRQCYYVGTGKLV